MLINVPSEPNRLKLIWYPTYSDVRTRYVVGELVRSDDKVSLAYYMYSSDFMTAQTLGFAGYPAFSIDTPVHHYNVLEIFSRRIPPRSRADFAEYLRRNRLIDSPYLTNFSILGYTGAPLPGDGFTFAVDFLYELLPHTFLMEVAGFRHYAGMSYDINAIVGQVVTFFPEDGNEHDPHAVRILLNGEVIGYVPRYYSSYYRYWLATHRVQGLIERIDGSLAKPRVDIWVMIQSTNNGYIPELQTEERIQVQQYR